MTSKSSWNTLNYIKNWYLLFIIWNCNKVITKWIVINVLLLLFTINWNNFNTDTEPDTTYAIDCTLCSHVGSNKIYLHAL